MAIAAARASCVSSQVVACSLVMPMSDRPPAAGMNLVTPFDDSGAPKLEPFIQFV
jgi:hypothetical protein